MKNWAARSMQHELQEAWQTIHHCLSVQAPEVLHHLQPGATEEQFHQAEVNLQVVLPEEVKALYRLHNGCVNPYLFPDGSFKEVVEPYERDTSELFLDWWSFHSLDALCSEWEVLGSEGYPAMKGWPAMDYFLVHEVREWSAQFLAQAAFYPLHWHHCWLPFMTGPGSYCIDLMPGPRGNVGQILFVPPIPTRNDIAHLVAPSLSVFFRDIATSLLAGRYVFDDATGLFLSEEGRGLMRTWDPSEVKSLWQARKAYTGRNDLSQPDTLMDVSPKGGAERLACEDQRGMSNQLQALWERTEGVLGQRAPALFDALRPGATALLLQQAETLLQIRLPEELKQFYACHNGVQWKKATKNFSWDLEHVVNGWTVHSLDTLCAEWIRNFENDFLSYWDEKNEVFREDDLFASPTHEVKAVYWHPCWLPFMVRSYSEHGIYYYQDYFIDTVPGPEGQYGQVLLTQTKVKYGRGAEATTRRRNRPRVVAPSLSVFFARFVDDLEAGNYRYDAATGMLWSRAEWNAASKRRALERYRSEREVSLGPLPSLVSEWDALEQKEP